MNTIAQNVGLPKANLHYYFNNKLGLYLAVLSNILELWDSTFNNLSVDDDPAEALERYIRAKMEFSRCQPKASRIFAMEVISGGDCLSQYFNQHYLGLVPVTALPCSRPGSPPARWTPSIPCT